MKERAFFYIGKPDAMLQHNSRVQGWLPAKTEKQAMKILEQERGLQVVEIRQEPDADWAAFAKRAFGGYWTGD